jgi:hypothetical protein
VQDKIISNYRDFVEEFRLFYKDEIKPLIENKDYATAEIELRNIIFAIEHERQIFNLNDVVVSVHYGLSLLSSIELLHEALKRNTFQEGYTKSLEAYLAQTTLPTQEEVKRQLKENMTI